MDEANREGGEEKERKGRAREKGRRERDGVSYPDSDCVWGKEVGGWIHGSIVCHIEWRAYKSLMNIVLEVQLSTKKVNRL